MLFGSPLPGLYLTTGNRTGVRYFCPALTWPFFLQQLYFLAEAELREPTPLFSVPCGSGASAILGLGNICLYISSLEYSLGGHGQGLSAVLALY